MRLKAADNQSRIHK